MPLEERPPGDLDGLGSGIGRQLEPGVEVVGRDVWAAHRRMVAGAESPQRPNAGQRPTPAAVGRASPATSEASTSSIGTVDRSPAGAVGHLDAAGRQRARAHGEDPRHPEQLGVGELDARAIRHDRRTGCRARSGRRGERSWSRSATSVDLRITAAPIATRWAAYGATSAGQTIPFSSWWASTMQATLRPEADPVRAHDDRMGARRPRRGRSPRTAS